MYCGECGEKTQKKDLYCGNCGAKLERNPQKLKMPKKIDSKTIKKIVIGMILIVFLILMINFFSNRFSPKEIVKKYITALAHKNYNQLYQYLELGNDNTFTNKEIFIKLMKESGQIELEKYHVAAVGSNANGTAIVTISYYDKIDKTEKSMNITLTKQKRKKWLFFEQWKIASSETKKLVVEDFKIIVPKDSIVTYAGVKVNKKYFNQKESTETTDIYNLKQVFAFSTAIEVELPSGYKVEDHVMPSTYRNHYSANISLSTISVEEQAQIADKIKKDITTIYNYAIDDKSYQEVKNKLNLSDEKFESIYITFVSKLKKAYNTLTAIEFTNITLSSAKLNEEGYLEFKFKANYNYTIQYTDFLNQKQTKQSKNYSYMTISYNMRDGNYNIVSADDLEDYFSRY